MSSALSKKQLISLLILLGLIFVLPLSLLLTKRRQEIRKKAASLTGPLQLTLTADPATNPSRGQTVTYTVKITNTGPPVQIRVAGAEFAVSPQISDFDIPLTQINCGSSMPSKAFADISGGRIRLICYKTPGPTPNEPLTISAAGQTGSTITLGSFQVTIKQSATGSYKISSKEADGGRNNIPLGNEPYTDLSNVGAEATLTIAGITPTPSPTSGAVTVTPTPAWYPATCSRSTSAADNCKDWGNANYPGWTQTLACGCCEQCCSTLINPATNQAYCHGYDPKVWCRIKEGTNIYGWEHGDYCANVPTGTPTVPPGTCPDGDKGNLTCDQDRKINILDFNLLLGSWAEDGPAPTPASGRHSADIAPPNVLDNKVGILDFNRLLGNWYDP